MTLLHGVLVLVGDLLADGRIVRSVLGDPADRGEDRLAVGDDLGAGVAAERRHGAWIGRGTGCIGGVGGSCVLGVRGRRFRSGGGDRLAVVSPEASSSSPQAATTSDSAAQAASRRTLFIADSSGGRE